MRIEAQRKERCYPPMYQQLWPLLENPHAGQYYRMWAQDRLRELLGNRPRPLQLLGQTGRRMSGRLWDQLGDLRRLPPPQATQEVT